MLKNKNEVTKISNIFFIAIAFMSFLSLITLIFGGVESIEGFNKNDYNYNLIMMSIYTILSVLTLYITNKKVNIYKDEYPVSRRVFNLFIAMSIMSVIITFTSNILTIFFYDTFSWTTLITLIFGYIPAYTLAVKQVSKGSMLSKDNEQKVNIANLVIIYLLMNYYVNAVMIISQMIFKTEEFITLLGGLCFSVIWICVVMISYKLINKKEIKLITNKKNKK